MPVLKTNFDGNPNVGLYGFATDKYCLIGKGLKKGIVNEIKKVLGVPVYSITINNSHLIGVYCTGNENILLVPEIIKEHEEKELKKLNLHYRIIKSKFSALGNNMIIFKENCIINPEFEDEIKKELHEFRIKRMNIGEHNAVGSCAVLNKNGCLISMDVNEDEILDVEKLLGINIGIGSVNKGNPYVRSGIICNSNGYIIGEETTGVETMRIEMALGFNRR